MSDSDIVFIDDADFEDKVLNNDIPVLVDFYAEWCGPCKAISPILHELATEFQGKIRIVKIDVDQNKYSASRFGIRSIPTLMLFDKGMQKDVTVGADPTKIRHMITNVT